MELIMLNPMENVYNLYTIHTIRDSAALNHSRTQKTMLTHIRFTSYMAKQQALTDKFQFIANASNVSPSESPEYQVPHNASYLLLKESDLYFSNLDTVNFTFEITGYWNYVAVLEAGCEC